VDPQGITLILGAIGTSAAAVITAVGIYRGKSAPHSAILGAMRLLWNWLDFTAITDELIERMRAGGTITSVIPDRVKIPVLRVVDPDQLKAQNRRASRALEEDDQDEAAND
jgi:hypothetical protein